MQVRSSLLLGALVSLAPLALQAQCTETATYSPKNPILGQPVTITATVTADPNYTYPTPPIGNPANRIT